MKKKITTALFPVATLLYSGCGGATSDSGSVNNSIMMSRPMSSSQPVSSIDSSKKSVLYSVSKAGEDKPIYEGRTILDYSKEAKISGKIFVTDELKDKIEGDSVYVVKTALEEDKSKGRESRSLHSVLPSSSIKDGALSVNILLDSVYEDMKDDLEVDTTPQEVEAIIDEHSEIILKDISEGGDINNDGEINADDLLVWDPKEDISKLKEEFQEKVTSKVEHMNDDDPILEPEETLEAPDLSSNATDVAVEVPKTTTTDYGIEGVRYLNQLRNGVGMVSYNTNDALQKAAQMHSKYNVANNINGHYEREGDSYFTGVTVGERVSRAGYSSSFVGENVSSGTNHSVKESIDGLFSAIYHRFGFLNFGFDEIGIGRDQKDSRVVFTYDNGAKDSNGNMLNNPEIVVWPYENQSDSLTAFYEESPDPLPECGVSGYPISIQFNPSQHAEGSISVTSFKLYKSDTNQEISNVKLMDQSTDHNHHFSSNEFALFPLDRLEWNTNYRVGIEYIEDGVVKNKDWNFKTRDLPTPNYTVANSGDVFNVQSGTSYFYLPPASCNDFFNGVNIVGASTLSIKTSLVDFNTIKVEATGSGSATITPLNGRVFTINVQ